MINWNVISVVINLIILGVGFLIQFGTKSHFDKVLENHKAKLRKRQISEQFMKQLWNMYRNYYNTVVNHSISCESDRENKKKEEEIAELNLRCFLEAQAPFIPEEVMTAINEIIDVQHHLEREETLLRTHNHIILLFREFFT